MVGDPDLLAAWRAGDTTAGNALVQRHFDAVYSFFRTKFDRDVDDLVQKTFLACVEAGDSFRGDSSFRTFLFAIARNQLRQLLRKELGRPNLDGVTSSMADSARSPSSFVHARGRQRSLLQALRAIPLDAQIAVELFYWEGLSGAELARVLDGPEGTARTRLRAARQALRDALSRIDPRSTSAASQDETLAQWVGAIRDYVAHEEAGRRKA
ncbi:MAG: sigma-70 family RNA polymerase sigma factor [Myxococcota bacterium]